MRVSKLHSLLSRIVGRKEEPRQPGRAPLSAVPPSTGAVEPIEDVGVVSLELDEPDVSLNPPSSLTGSLSSGDQDFDPEVAADPIFEDESTFEDEPPESGPIASNLQKALQDSTIPQRDPTQSAAQATLSSNPGPTMEQLGETVALDEPAGPALELDAPGSSPSPEALSGSEQAEPSSIPQSSKPPSGMEAQLGAGEAAKVRSPESTRKDLERVRFGEVSARVTSRPVLSSNVVQFVEASQSFEPATFLELLDSSLALK